jgi:hypothetical protein
MRNQFLRNVRSRAAIKKFAVEKFIWSLMIGLQYVLFPRRLDEASERLPLGILQVSTWEPRKLLFYVIEPIDRMTLES